MKRASTRLLLKAEKFEKIYLLVLKINGESFQSPNPNPKNQKQSKLYTEILNTIFKYIYATVSYTTVSQP